MFQEIPRNCRYVSARVSSKSQEENSSLESQKQELLQHGVQENKILKVALRAIIWKLKNKHHLIDSSIFKVRTD